MIDLNGFLLFAAVLFCLYQLLKFFIFFFQTTYINYEDNLTWMLKIAFVIFTTTWKLQFIKNVV